MSDLETYAHWLDVVEAVEPIATEEAWIVTLKARVGPFARSKRLRMERTELTDSAVKFERRELDGKDHSSWVLEASVGAPETDEMTSQVDLSLEYGGSMWSGMLDGVLDAAATRATKKLQDYVKP